MTSGRQRVDRQGTVSDCCTNFTLVSLKSTKQQVLWMLSFEHSGFESLDKIHRKGFELHRALPLVCLTILSHITAHMTTSPRPYPPFLCTAGNQKTGAEKD